MAYRNPFADTPPPQNTLSAQFDDGEEQIDLDMDGHQEDSGKQPGFSMSNVTRPQQHFD